MFTNQEISLIKTLLLKQKGNFLINQDLSEGNNLLSIKIIDDTFDALTNSNLPLSVQGIQLILLLVRETNDTSPIITSIITKIENKLTILKQLI